jgi:DNA-binding GntR family transcriptional regulator
MIPTATPEPTGGKTDLVAEAIRAGIRAGLFVPGQHLVEADLTQQLKISRSSLREALRHLHGEGIVAMNRYRGTHICRLTRDAADDLLEVLEVLVRVAARRAAISSQAKRIVMDTAIAAAERHRASADHRSYLSVRQAFYDALFEISGNRELSRVIPLRRADLFRAQIRPYQTLEQQHIHADGYKIIAQSVLAGDEHSADAAVGEHFAATRSMIDKLPVIAFAMPDALYSSLA